eukprot:scaffold1386_cov119-Isochrysis_galbana.AAC.11
MKYYYTSFCSRLGSRRRPGAPVPPCCPRVVRLSRELLCVARHASARGPAGPPGAGPAPAPRFAPPASATHPCAHAHVLHIFDGRIVAGRPMRTVTVVTRCELK